MTNTSYAIQAGALRENPNSGPDGVGVQVDIAYTLEARAEVQAVYGTPSPANDNRRQVTAPGAPLRFLSVCSGIEAASCAWGPLGWQAVAFSEIEKFPSAVLAHHYPDVPNLGDFTKIDATTLGPVDILAGGTPCQAFSVAGLRGSLDDARGNLSLVYVRLAHELANGNGLRNAVWENVPGVLSTKDNAFGCFLAGLVGADDAVVPSAKPADGRSNRHWSWRKGGRYPVLDDEGEKTGEYVTVDPWHACKWPDAGMVAGPKGRAAWRILDAQFFGLAQRRRRVIVVADFGNGADPAAVLFERQSGNGNTPPRREKGQGIAHATAPSLTASGRGVERTGESRGQDPVVAVTFDKQSNCEYGEADVASAMMARDYKSATDLVAYQPVVSATGEISHTLKAEGADASEDGTGRGVPVVAFTAKDYGGDAAVEIAPTLRAGGHSGSHANGGVGPAVAFGGQMSVPQVDEEMSQTLQAKNPQAAMTQSAVRRLTPVECERLQGFPDGYTNIPWRNKPEAPDGPRYKALGNSWAVPKFAWLGARIARLMPDNDNREPA